MSSTITIPSQDIVIEAKTAAAFTAAVVDIEALQVGTNVVNSTVAGGSSIVVSGATHNRKTILLDTAAGTAVTLPAATGAGYRWKFLTTTPTSAAGTVVITAGAATVFNGLLYGTRVDSGNAVLGFAANGSSNNVITLDHATKGGVSKGDWLEIEDIAAGIFSVKGQLSATGAAFATPFSG